MKPPVFHHKVHKAINAMPVQMQCIQVVRAPSGILNVIFKQITHMGISLAWS